MLKFIWPKCPHCGVRVVGHHRGCPSCQRWLVHNPEWRGPWKRWALNLLMVLVYGGFVAALWFLLR